MATTPLFAMYVESNMPEKDRLNIWRRQLHIAANLRVIQIRIVFYKRNDASDNSHLDESESDGEGVILKSAGGALRKPNAAQPLGCVSDVSVVEAGKDPEGLLIGQISLCLKEGESGSSSIAIKQEFSQDRCHLIRNFKLSGGILYQSGLCLELIRDVPYTVSNNSI